MAERKLSIVIEVDGAQDAIGQVRRMRSALDDLSGGAEGLRTLARQGREVSQVMKEMGKTFDLRQRQKEMVGDLEDFFRRITAGARTTGDVFKNIWREAADYFRRILREMAGAAAGNPGGGFLPGSGFALPIPLGGTSLFGLPAIMPVGDVLGRLQGIGPFSGAQTALGGLGLFGLSMGAGNPVLRGLGAAAGGALTGFSVGGPMGAVVGGIIGGIASLFGKDKNKQHDAEIANQGFAQLRQIKEDYERQRRDFASTIDAMNRVWAQMQGAFVRRESAPDQRRWFDIMQQQVRQIEDERNRRRQWLALRPVPEFQEGGLIGNREQGTGNRGMWAVVHPGEFVMSQRAVDRWGVSLLEGLNRGSGIGDRESGGGYTMAVWAPSKEFAADIVERGVPVVLRRGGAASRALRG